MNPNMVILFFGANDSARNKRQDVPVPEYTQHLIWFIKQLKTKYKDVKILILTPPPVDADAWGKHKFKKYGDSLESDRSLDITKTYADACEKVGKRIRYPRP
eukprot:UN18392